MFFIMCVQVMVVRPGWLQLIPQRGDCRVGDRIDIPLALWGIQDPPNTCSQTPYVFDTYSNTHRNTSTNSQANFFSDTQNPQCGESLLEDPNLVAVTDCSRLSLHVHTEPSGIFTDMSGASPSLQLYMVHPFILHWFLQYSLTLMALSFILGISNIKNKWSSTSSHTQSPPHCLHTHRHPPFRISSPLHAQIKIGLISSFLLV